MKINPVRQPDNLARSVQRFEDTASFQTFCNPTASSMTAPLQNIPTAPAAATSLRQRLSQPGLVIAPGVYDMVSLRMADTLALTRCT